MVHIDDVIKEDPLKEQILRMVRKRGMTVSQIASSLDRGPEQVRRCIQVLRQQNYNVHILSEGNVEFSRETKQGGTFRIPKRLISGRKFRFGAIGDTHLASKYARLDALNAMYDIFEREGIREVFHTGNLVDGECRFNKYDLVAHGIDGQLECAANEYPHRKGVMTRFICGDDHEGWWAQREGINIGQVMEDRFRKKGRRDLSYIGYMEADVRLPSRSGNPTWVRPMHPGGGSAYALSYAPQKIVESLQGGEKPHVLLIGHYHKLDLCVPREVWCVQTGCFQDQTPFMRKKKIQAMVGGWKMELTQAEDGFVPRLVGDLVKFYDRGFYEGEKFARW